MILLIARPLAFPPAEKRCFSAEGRRMDRSPVRRSDTGCVDTPKRKSGLRRFKESKLLWPYMLINAYALKFPLCGVTYIDLSFDTVRALREEGVLTSRRVGAWMEAP